MKPLDVMRGFYVRSPRFVRDAVRPLISLVPTGVKFGRTYADWRARIAKAESDPQYANEQHLASLRALLAKAYQGSPFYRTLIDDAFGTGFDASALMPEDLRRLPVLGKKQLREAGEAALAVPRWQLDRTETSGSNAEPPFGFFLDKDRSAREMAFVYDAWSRVGFSEREARISLRGFHLKGGGPGLYDWDPALRELKLAVFPMTAENVQAYLDEIDRKGIQFLYGYPSAMELLCRRMRQLGRVPRPGIKGILPISEPLYDHQRALIRSVLGDVKFGVFYGLSEKVAFAAEVQDEDGLYEFNPLYGVAELLDENGNPVIEPGREGRIVGTGFLSTGMPFIRYDTGDFGTLVELATPENGRRLRIRALAPRRKPGFLISFDGQRIVTTDLTPEDPKLFNGIAEYQFYQDTPGEVVIRHILDPGGSTADVERLRAYVSAKSRGCLVFTLEAVPQIAGGRGGKRAFIDQRLDITRY
ncbi:phenylacetate-CoA ligase [Xaviernesmea oryzae]|uniref:Phenylacetate-CoA ligase n=1 Tax=Xaviernesmea oryzae TaxID=464029 RepID=A0A1X7FU92_9HYPH|nr:phenylacetate--CoA ligase family protein [Xaviernesmea oryzae]SMF58891.1 phenylacetate-CoA ligase [Xaviernesmea oryzae]